MRARIRVTCAHVRKATTWIHARVQNHCTGEFRSSHATTEVCLLGGSLDMRAGGRACGRACGRARGRAVGRVYVLECVCACLRACVRVFVYACVRACVCACVRACERACVLVCVRACVRACMRACVRTCVLACVLACVRVRACLRVFGRACVCAGMHACLRACVRVCACVRFRPLVESLSSAAGSGLSTNASGPQPNAHSAANVVRYTLQRAILCCNVPSGGAACCTLSLLQPGGRQACSGSSTRTGCPSSQRCRTTWTTDG
jgi:hypothetical protein